MTISGYEWMLVITAVSISTTIGVAGVSTLMVEKLRKLAFSRSFEIKTAPAMARVSVG